MTRTRTGHGETDRQQRQTLMVTNMISVITPVRNGRAFVEACIKTVIDQRCPAAEHIIVDGASTDGTLEIIETYAEKHTHIRWVSEPDQGQSDAMNKGLAMARGNIVAMLNTDDFYEPNVLNRVLELFKHLDEPALLVGNCNVWDNGGKLRSVNKPTRMKITDLLLGLEIRPWPINPSQYFYHASLHEKIGPYRTDEYYALDLDFILKAVSAAHVTYVNETWGNYRFMEGTKTYDDWKRGSNVARYQAYLKAHKRSLSASERLEYSLKWFLSTHKILVRSLLLSNTTPGILRAILQKMVRH